ncbi:PP2C family protein-serine/threonine phosphatase [Bacillus sp. Marseille-P3661]|uniref:PP2C family protein-serine/threonine phosphatase n=1 Tax=Bacillus sp. Marseille-P3661 TaxID=1936234 RepID=UPI0021555DA5|nr:PP2C family protein-serine/threonine phosphatase [Bacillus sp. Marseille-P3661]
MYANRWKHEYKQYLMQYINSRDKSILYKGQKLSRHLIETKVSPEEVIKVHISSLKDLQEVAPYVQDSFDFLLKVMTGYGEAYRELLNLRYQQSELQSEIQVAANMQQTLLRSEWPTVESLDIGAISRPARQMNGDYYHFVQDENGSVSVAVADVIGKGIPAALCMSMIKYSMDSLPETRMTPRYVLENLNRIVEQNVDSSMFITMFYGIYDSAAHKFRYSSAGHEPGFYYHAESDQFEELKTKGLVLGVSKTLYEEYERNVLPGDMIVLLTDGLTECRIGNRFITREEVAGLIKKYIHLPSQDIVNNIYSELHDSGSYKLTDDFTLIILRRRV